MRFFTSLKMHNLRTFLSLVILLKVFVRGYRSIGGVESPGDARTHPIERRVEFGLPGRMSVVGVILPKDIGLFIGLNIRKLDYQGRVP